MVYYSFAKAVQECKSRERKRALYFVSSLNCQLYGSEILIQKFILIGLQAMKLSSSQNVEESIRDILAFRVSGLSAGCTPK